MQPDECFVCTGNEGPLFRVCDCRTVIHKECFRQVVARVPSHSTRCPVCRKEYSVPYKSRVVVEYAFVLRLCCITVTIIALLGSIVMMTRALALHFAMLVWGSILVLESLVGITALVVIRHTNTRNHLLYDQTRVVEFDAMVPVPREIVQAV